MPILRNPPRQGSSNLTISLSDMVVVGGPLLQNMSTTISWLSFCLTILNLLQLFLKITKSYNLNSHNSGPKFLTFRLYVPNLPDLCGNFQYCW